MADINRTTNSMALPSDISAEILQKVQEESAIMRLARKITLPGRGVTIPVVAGDPTAAWVAETASKPVSNGTPATKLMSAYKIAVIETFSKEFVRDIPQLYDALVRRLPAALAKIFDGTIIGAVANPIGNTNFDTFAACTKQSILTSGADTTYGGLVAADTDIAEHGGMLNGFALSPAARGILLAAVDGNDRPLFINSVAEGAIPQILGAPVYFNRALYKAGTAGTAPEIVGIAGDWTQAMYGTVNGVEISMTDTATVVDSDSNQINLWQQNMIAVRAEIEVGFRANTDCFNLLTGATPAAVTT